MRADRNTTFDSMPPTLSLEQACDLLGITKATSYRLVCDGAFPRFAATGATAEDQLPSITRGIPSSFTYSPDTIVSQSNVLLKRAPNPFSESTLPVTLILRPSRWTVSSEKSADPG